MGNVVIGLIAVWIAALIFLVGRSTYLLLAVLENFAPNPIWGPRDFLRTGILCFRYRIVAMPSLPKASRNSGGNIKKWQT